MTPPEAFRAVCTACVQHLEGNRYGALAGADPEYLHQIRVALRRLRTAFDVFADALPGPAAAELLGELRWLRRALGGGARLGRLPRGHTASGAGAASAARRAAGDARGVRGLERGGRGASRSARSNRGATMR